MRILIIESLPNSGDWVDRDEIMLHACFQILKDFFEKEGVDEFDSSPFKKELKLLYNWWLERSKGKINESKDDVMLARLVKIRTMLWT